MGTLQAPVQPVRGAKIVAFDFDGTLTRRDSFMAFLRWRAGRLGFAGKMAGLAPAAAVYLATRDRGMLKAAAGRAFLKGLTVGELRAAARNFAALSAPSLLRPDALRRWREWQAQDARLVIVTASPELLVEPFARELGAFATIGTRMAVGPDGRLTGDLDGENCRGAQKVVRLQAIFGAGLRLTAAYGDTAGDREMLAIADEAGYRVFAG